MMTDPIADMLTRIRNAGMARHKMVSMPSSKMKLEIARILKEEGFIRGYDLQDTNKPQSTLRIHLKYDENGKPIIAGLERVSKPGRRIYAGRNDIPWVRSGLGIAIVSTSKGMMTGRQARREGVGGEVICYVW
ncbi:MAG TPA: 30S ribosomal protein S8 [Anaerolineae bacterium]|nr:30S ribosomal protein S8 [Caldilineae bacterium]HID35286.1 30S ribosomal protein S8 [Anaerolineae bacterium]HIQ12183.1 30S ribosomal protein S8 [Caldilineales bacterium]